MRGRNVFVVLAVAGLALPGCRDRRQDSATPRDEGPVRDLATGAADTAEGADTTESADTAAVQTGPVTVQGRVVEAGTGVAVERAVVIVLKPGVSARQWAEAQSQAETEQLMEAATITDDAGDYEIAGLQRGRVYTVMVGADGYRSAVFEGGLEIGLRDPPVMSMGQIELGRS